MIQYYWQNPDALARVDQFRLNSLRGKLPHVRLCHPGLSRLDIEKSLGVTPIETVSIHPERPLYDACRKMLEARARRIPIVDIDDETRRTTVVSVITQYRLLKFVAVNVKETQKLRKPLKELMKVGTYDNLATAYMDTPVMDVIHMLVKKSISSVPIIDKQGGSYIIALKKEGLTPAGTVLNIFESVDVITLIKGGVYDDLNLTVGDALLKRSDVRFPIFCNPCYADPTKDFPGIYTCTMQDQLSTIYDTIRRSRVHRFIVIDEENKLKGVLTLSDILEYTLLEGEENE